VRWQRKLHLISVIARAVRANDLAAAGVARWQEMQHERRRALEAKHARAEARKAEMDAARLHSVRLHLQRIAAVCAARPPTRVRLLAAEREAAATLQCNRPPPVLIPSDAPVGSALAYSPCIIFTSKHVDKPPPTRDDEPRSPTENGYVPDEESGFLSPRPLRATRTIQVRPLCQPRGLGLPCIKRVAQKMALPRRMRAREAAPRPNKSLQTRVAALNEYLGAELYQC
jgi:hypothetical protein